MNIDPNVKLQQVAPSSKISAEQGNRQQQQAASPVLPAADGNQVSAFSKTVESTFQSLSEAEVVDIKKVRQLQQAIITGTLPMDDNSLIDAILEMHKK